MHTLINCMAVVLIASIYTTTQTTAMPAGVKKFYCGSDLAEALRKLCDSSDGYNPPPWDNDTDNLNAIARTAAAISPPSSSSDSNNSKQSGVATECCKKSCTWKTLVSYCHASVRPKESDLKQLGFGEPPVEAQ